MGKRERIVARPYQRHGESRTRLYGTWQTMLYRCENPKDKEYAQYGGRGIRVCKEWYDYKTFKAWAISAGWRENLTIERMDNNGNYEPKNCRWATMTEQIRNRTITLFVFVKKPLIEVCKEYGLPYDSTRKRIKSGQDINEILRKQEKKQWQKMKQC